MCVEQPRRCSGPHNGWSHLLWQFCSSRRTLISRASTQQMLTPKSLRLKKNATHQKTLLQLNAEVYFGQLGLLFQAVCYFILGIMYIDIRGKLILTVILTCCICSLSFTTVLFGCFHIRQKMFNMQVYLAKRWLFLKEISDDFFQKLWF